MSEQLRQARIKAGITVQRLSIQASVSRGTIEKAEKGREAISLVTAMRIVNSLNSLANTNYTVESLNILVSQ